VEKRVGDEVIGATINKTGAFRFRATKVGKDTALATIRVPACSCCSGLTCYIAAPWIRPRGPQRRSSFRMASVRTWEKRCA